MSGELKNPFPDPSTVDREKNKEIMDLIREEFKTKGQMEFHDMIKYFEISIGSKDKERSIISAFYCTNAILSNKNMNDHDKAFLVSGIREEIAKLGDEGAGNELLSESWTQL